MRLSETEFFERFGLDLNAQQEDAVKGKDMHAAVIAVPGSGKTTCMVAKIGHMIYVEDVRPDEILAITFTKAAAESMKKKYTSLFGDAYANDISFRTINSLAYGIVTDAMRNGILPRKYMSDTPAVLRDTVRSVSGKFPSEAMVREVQSGISYLKNMMFEGRSAEEGCHLGGKIVRKRDIEGELSVDGRSLVRYYTEYTREMQKKHLMDFDDQLLMAYSVLRERRDVLDAIRARYGCILVDEAQDTSFVQHRIISLLAGDTARLFMVGDDDQSIYSFRGAAPEFLLDFRKEHPDGKVYFLKKNYRSAVAITDLASDFIVQVPERYEKTIVPAREDKGSVRVSRMDMRQQYEYIADTIMSLPGTTAVLYRNNDSAIPVAGELIRRGMPFELSDRNGCSMFFTQTSVQDARAFMTFALDRTDAESFRRVAVRCGCYASLLDVQAILLGAYRGEDLWKRMCTHPDVAQSVRNGCRTVEYELDRIADSTACTALDIIEGITSRAGGKDRARFNLMRAMTRSGESCRQFLEGLDALSGDISEVSSPGSDIVLSTVHASKGLEYDNVIVIDAVNGVWPPADCMSVEEEARLFYVAITRAKDRIVVMDYPDMYQPFVDDVKISVGDKEGKIELPRRAKKPNKSGEHKPRAVRRSDEYNVQSGKTAAQSEKHAKQSQKRKEAIDSLRGKHYFEEGMRIRHRKYGPGQISSRKENRIEVLFDDGNTRKFDEATVVACGIITAE